MREGPYDRRLSRWPSVLDQGRGDRQEAFHLITHSVNDLDGGLLPVAALLTERIEKSDELAFQRLSGRTVRCEHSRATERHARLAPSRPRAG